VRAPTVWEEGRLSGSRVVRLAVLTTAAVTAVDLVLGHTLGLLFDVGFVLVVLAAALAVRPQDFFAVSVLPPLLLLVVCAALALVDHTAVADPGDGVVQSLLSGLVRHAIALGAGYALALCILGMRTKVLHRRGALT
jgi:hypothetical protein